MKKFEVELAVCVTYGNDSGPWHVEIVEVEIDKDNPTTYELLQVAEEAFNTDEDNIAAIAYYSSSEIVKCSGCGQEYNLSYDEECQNPDCPLKQVDE